ncbi:MAG: hypothetical protein Kow00117_10970 [Phototrophicales bacterium]
MQRKNLIKTLKWLWFVCVILGVTVYCVTNWERLSRELRAIHWVDLGLGVLFLIVGKLLLVELARISLEFQGYSLTFSRQVYINSISQLGKYLPGGIWHFVGQAGFYRLDQIPLKSATQAMMLENIWMILSAVMVGTLGCIWFLTDILTSILLTAVLFGCWVGILWLMHKHISLRLLVVQAGIWVALGLGFWTLLPDKSLFGLSIGAFSLSWVIGFISLFAPGGIGVREAALAGIMGVAINPTQALIYGGVNRLLWIITEIILGVFVAQWLNARHHETWSDGVTEVKA